MDLNVASRAFFIGLSLIIAIGAQNIYIIKTGLQKKNVLLSAVTAATCDSLLIIMGTFFMSTLMMTIPNFVFIARWAGILFLLYYGTLSFINAISSAPKGWENAVADVNKKSSAINKAKNSSVFLTTLAFSLFNPHVYLDTFLILGNIGSRLPLESRFSFILGASAASFFWFILTGLGAKFASRFFQNIKVARIFDFIVALAMFLIAYGLYENSAIL